jgi:hypothetical protein
LVAAARDLKFLAPRTEVRILLPRQCAMQSSRFRSYPTTTSCLFAFVLMLAGCGDHLRSQGGVGGNAGDVSSGDASVSDDVPAPMEAGPADVSDGSAGEEANPCGPHDPLGPTLTVNVLGTAGGSLYDGPAVVERSTEGELVLYYLPPPSPAPDGGGGGGAGMPPSPVGVHASLSGFRPMPLLPVGAQVWLSKNPPANQLADRHAYGILPWGIAVRDKKDGRVLLGATRNFPDAVSAPWQVGSPVPTCTGFDFSACGGRQDFVYSSVEVQSDVPVTLHDGESATMTFGGSAYDVKITAQTPTGQPGRICFDYHPPSGVGLDIRIKDWTGAASALEMGDPPACSLGNDTGVSSYIGSNLDAYTGVLEYLREERGSLIFRAPGVSDPFVPGQPALFSVSTSSPLGLTLTTGQTVWMAKIAPWVHVLRTEQGGDLLLVDIARTAVMNPDLSAQIAAELGVGVTVRDTCVYTVEAQASMFLREFVFATPTPTVVKTGTVSALQLGGKNYRAWVRGPWSDSVQIYPAP